MNALPADLCISSFLKEAERLGIEVRWTKTLSSGLDAAYLARPGVPGILALRESEPPPSPQQICILLTHEMVHVLQHWHGKLMATPPLGWPVYRAPKGRQLSVQEQEAYTAQQDPYRVLQRVKTLSPHP